MTLGPFVLYADFANKSFVTRDKDVAGDAAAEDAHGIETMKRTGCKQALVVPGRYDESLAWDYQTANVVDNLRACMDVCAAGRPRPRARAAQPEEPPGPLPDEDPPGVTRSAGRSTARRARSSNDIYHQQITEGNLIPNIEAAWDEIAAFHIGDNPGRKEPTSGEINYRNIFKWHPRQGLPGRPVHGARAEQARQGRRARRHRRVPRLRSVLEADHAGQENDDELTTSMRRRSPGAISSRRRPRPRSRRPSRRLRRVRRRARTAIKVGVIGCGGRGTGAAIDCLKADPGVEIVALGDLVPDRVESSLERAHQGSSRTA